MRAVSLLFHDVYVADPAESGFVSDAANRYKLSVAAFEAQLDAVAAVRTDAPLLFDGREGNEGCGEGSSQSRQRREERKEPALQPLRSDPLRPQPPLRPTPWSITFDDGGVSYYTRAADRLEARGWRGHCFVSTDFVGRSGFLDAAQIRELDARGHVIGSHSASHPARFSACPFEQMVREWRDSRARLEDLVGHAVHVASVPGGYFSAAVARAAAEAGLTVLFNSEPVTAIRVGEMTIIGRFTIRHGDAPDAAMQFLAPSPWARSAAWLDWNAKGLIKPLLGPAYRHVADWVCAIRRSSPAVSPTEVRRGES
jgi:peptidoglycan/xylan/chitin deacetylase (PgdA/CDA1 family)